MGSKPHLTGHYNPEAELFKGGNLRSENRSAFLSFSLIFLVLEDNSQGYPVEAEPLPETVYQITFIGKMYTLVTVCHDDKGWRFAA